MARAAIGMRITDARDGGAARRGGTPRTDAHGIQVATAGGSGASMNIGETALASGISVKMIRHYEAIGLVPPAARTPGGYRSYGDDDLRRLIFIRHARAVGFATPQIRRLLSLWDDGERAVDDVVRLAEEHLQYVRARIGELQDIAGALKSLIAQAADVGRPTAPRIEPATRPPQSIATARRSGGRGSAARPAVARRAGPARSASG
jgi:DNA-binding transcriptional MerR regulator